MEKETIIELIKKSQAGDMAAMEALLAAAHTPVSYQCRKLLKNQQDVEDVTQEVLLTMYTKLNTLQEPAAFWKWLNRIAATRCMNVLTRTHVDLQILEDEEGHSILDTLENLDDQLVPDAALDNAETARMIDEIVTALPLPQRMCTLLFYYDELTVKEIAEVMQTSENTVKSRLNYARKSIKERVLDYEKSGIKLYQISPLPFLLYFLRRTASDNADAAAASKMAAQVMAKGAASINKATASSEPAKAAESVVGEGGTAIAEAAAEASTGAGTAATSAAGTVTSQVVKGISLKMVAGIVAGLVAVGGATAGIAAVVNQGKEPAISASAETTTAMEETGEIPESAETDTSMELPEEKQLLGTAQLAQLPYTGQIDSCLITKEQADAFAQILEDCIVESQDLNPTYPSFCRAALFDAGGDAPALWVTEGICIYGTDESGYMPSFSRIYCWDGTQAVLALENLNETQASNLVLTEEGLLVDYFTPAWGFHNHGYAELYGLSEGMISEEPLHIYEQYGIDISDTPSEEAFQALVTEYGRPSITYAFDTLTGSTWQDSIKLEPYMEPVWMICSLDGTFLSPDTARAENRVLHWSGVTWELGHGQAGHQDASHYWEGEWGDAADVAEVLRSEPQDASITEGTGSSAASASVDGIVQRTTLDSEGFHLERYCEIPVFEETSAGYEKINTFFQSVLNDYQAPEGNASIALEMAEALPPTESDPYFHTISARVNDWTDNIVSVSLTSNSYLGGGREYLINNYNFSIETGEQLFLTDLVEETEAELQEMTMDAMLQTYPEIESLPDALEAIRNYNPKNYDFYLSNGQIHICFDRYEIGFIEFEVTIPAVIKADRF